MLEKFKGYILLFSGLISFSIVFLSKYSSIFIVNVLLSVLSTLWLYYGILIISSNFIKEKKTFNEINVEKITLLKDKGGSPKRIPSIEIKVSQEYETGNHYGFCIKPEGNYYRLLLPFSSVIGERALTIFSDIILGSFTSANKKSVFDSDFLKLYIVQIPDNLEVLDDFTTQNEVEELLVKYPYVN